MDTKHEKYKKQRSLSAAQNDIFLVTRPEEELFYVPEDSLQLNTLVSNENVKNVLSELRNVLHKWQKETGDSTPTNLTKDWYTRDSGQKIEANFGILGEMPSESVRADTITRKINLQLT